MYSPEEKGIGKNLEFRDLGPQRIDETLAKDLRHARKGLTTRLIEFTCRTSQVRVTSSSSQDPTFILIFFSLLFIASDCYSRNDVQVVNGKINFQVCNIFHYRSLEQFNTAVERYATSSIWD